MTVIDVKLLTDIEKFACSIAGAGVRAWAHYVVDEKPHNYVVVGLTGWANEEDAVDTLSDLAFQGFALVSTDFTDPENFWVICTKRFKE